MGAIDSRIIPAPSYYNTYKGNSSSLYVENIVQIPSYFNKNLWKYVLEHTLTLKVNVICLNLSYFWRSSWLNCLYRSMCDIVMKLITWLSSFIIVNMNEISLNLRLNNILLTCWFTSLVDVFLIYAIWQITSPWLSLSHIFLNGISRFVICHSVANIMALIWLINLLVLVRLNLI